LTEPSAAAALRPILALAGRLPGFLPAALGRDDRVLFRDFVVLGSALFAIALVAYALTTPTGAARSRATLAVGRDFLAGYLVLRLRASPGPGLLESQKTRQSALRIDRAQLFSIENKV
jgi:hypothetical protein